MGKSIQVLLCAVLCSNADSMGEPLSVIDSFQTRLGRITTFSASVERLQTFRGFHRGGSGKVLFERNRGSVYTYQTPGKYRFFSSDSTAYGIDLAKRNGWRTDGVPPAAQMREQIDPLFRLFRLVQIDKDLLTYRGNDGSLLLFNWLLPGGIFRCVGFDSNSYQCRIIETIDSEGRTVDRTSFTYDKGTAATFPSRITLTERIGTEVSVDSIVLHGSRTNAALPADAFTAPGGVSWMTRGDGRLP